MYFIKRFKLTRSKSYQITYNVKRKTYLPLIEKYKTIYCLLSQIYDIINGHFIGFCFLSGKTKQKIYIRIFTPIVTS